MAFEFDFNVMFKAASGYLARGFRVVRLNGFWPDGRCTCGNPDCAVGRHGEKAAGKHPVGDNWQERYARSEDDLLDWDDGTPFNLGLILGPGSGVIDNEDDAPEGKAFRGTLGMQGLVTPTWGSGRGTHQLTRWDPRLAGCKGVEKPGGLECRLGAGSASTQSVLPPSWHWSGVQYQWLEGLSVDDVPVAVTPESLVAACVNGRGSRSAPASAEPPATTMLFGEVLEGGRHRAILRWCWFKICNLRNPMSSGNREILTREVQMANLSNCKPPLDDVEVRKIIHDCLAHYRKKHEQGWRPDADGMTTEQADAEAGEIGEGGARAVEVCGFELHGLRRIQVGAVESYDPGDWSVTIIHGDPPQIQLRVPQWDDTPCRGRISISYDDFLLPNKVALAIFKATRRVIINADSGKWFGIWKGIDASKKTGGVSIPGLASKLMAQLRGGEVWVGTSSLRYATLAGYLLDTLHRGQKLKAGDQEQKPLETGRPCWVRPDEVWFSWAFVWEEVASRHDCAPGERTRIRDMLIERLKADDLPHKRYRFASGRRAEFVVFTAPWLEAVQRLAAGSDDGAEGVVEDGQ